MKPLSVLLIIGGVSLPISIAWLVVAGLQFTEQLFLATLLTSGALICGGLIVLPEASR